MNNALIGPAREGGGGGQRGSKGKEGEGGRGRREREGDCELRTLGQFVMERG